MGKVLGGPPRFIRRACLLRGYLSLRAMTTLRRRFGSHDRGASLGLGGLVLNRLAQLGGIARRDPHEPPLGVCPPPDHFPARTHPLHDRPALPLCPCPSSPSPLPPP